MRTLFAGFTAAFALVVGSLGYGVVAVGEDAELTQNVLTLTQLPPRVAETLKLVLQNKRPGEIREIRCDGTPVLYEAEYTDDRRKKIEVVMLADGRRIPAGQVKGRGPLKVRNVQMKDLPPAVTETLKKQLGEGPFQEMNELRYRQIVVLYEVGNESALLWFYPGGPLAREQTKAQDAEDPAQGEGEGEDKEPDVR